VPSFGAPALAGHRLAGKEHYSYGNPHKLLMDPYAKALSGHMRWDDALFGYTISHPDEDLSFDERDSAPFMPKAIVIDPASSWGGDTPPPRPGTEPSSMSCTSRVSPRAIQTCRSICAAPTPG